MDEIDDALNIFHPPSYTKTEMYASADWLTGKKFLTKIGPEQWKISNEAMIIIEPMVNITKIYINTGWLNPAMMVGYASSILGLALGKLVGKIDPDELTKHSSAIFGLGFIDDLARKMEILVKTNALPMEKR